MASVLRTGLANLNPTGLLVGLCKATPKCHNVVVTQIAPITSKAMRQDRPPRPPPFDWKNKPYNFWAWNTDPMEKRFDDNTKVISIEGMPAIGKDKFAKKLAEELEMTYVPPPTFDEIWLNPYDFDLRSLNHKLPINSQCYDIQSFLEDPTGPNTAAMQVAMFFLRADQYIDTLCDVLSTGNGAVVQRCPWSDANFMLAMLKNNYISRGVYEYYNAGIVAIVQELMKPHLILYLDAPISVVKNNIKKRNIPYEVNSKALTDKYLQDLETIYKENYLREMTNHGHLLIYDWATEGDIGIVIEDIERLDFDIKEGSEKFFDWKYEHITDLKEKRWDYQYEKEKLLLHLNVCRFDIPEMLRSPEDSMALEAAIVEVPQLKYAPGFNPEFDKGVLFNLDRLWDEWRPRRPLRKDEKRS